MVFLYQLRREAGDLVSGVVIGGPVTAVGGVQGPVAAAPRSAARGDVILRHVLRVARLVDVWCGVVWYGFNFGDLL